MLPGAASHHPVALSTTSWLFTGGASEEHAPVEFELQERTSDTSILFLPPYGAEGERVRQPRLWVRGRAKRVTRARRAALPSGAGGGPTRLHGHVRRRAGHGDQDAAPGPQRHDGDADADDDDDGSDVPARRPPAFSVSGSSRQRRHSLPLGATPPWGSVGTLAAPAPPVVAPGEAFRAATRHMSALGKEWLHKLKTAAARPALGRATAAGGAPLSSSPSSLQRVAEGVLASLQGAGGRAAKAREAPVGPPRSKAD